MSSLGYPSATLFTRVVQKIRMVAAEGMLRPENQRKGHWKYSKRDFWEILGRLVFSHFK